MKVSKIQQIQNVFEYRSVFKIHSKIRTELSRVVKEVRVKAKKCQNSEGLKKYKLHLAKKSVIEYNHVLKMKYLTG